MTRAEKALVLAGGEENTVTIGSAGPEFLVSMILQNIGRRHLLNHVKMDINQLYQEYTSKLEYQIYQFPRKRLLRRIHKLQEELTVVRLVNTWQTKAFNSFLQVLDPETFELPTADRLSMFPPESECISESLRSLQGKAVELEALEGRTQYLREQLKQSVEILEEDHGKAILMFTIITTIFLPLSFVTSFFGMNTSDIRNIDRTQAFFWVIAIPFTAAIVLIAIFKMSSRYLRTMMISIYNAFVNPSCFTVQLPSFGNPGASPSEPFHPAAQYAIAYKKPAFPGINGGGVPPSPPRIANPASSNFQ
ncbi:hypothetical protein ACET3X_002096 [Alternaria dauci]|uniref:Uncharacterized protein n=1 Tax=Alternaria dauci TaxID=48095 RepID=A0ABR3V0P8_9PLEO